MGAPLNIKSPIGCSFLIAGCQGFFQRLAVRVGLIMAGTVIHYVTAYDNSFGLYHRTGDNGRIICRHHHSRWLKTQLRWKISQLKCRIAPVF